MKTERKLRSDASYTTLPLWTLEDIAELQDLVGRVRQLTYDYPGVLARTLNRVAAGARTDAVAMVREAYHLTAADARRVRKRIRIRKATWQRPIANLWAKDRHGVHISERNPVQVPQGVEYTALKSRKILKHGFIGHGQHSGKIIVFRRSLGAFKKYRGKRGVHMRQRYEAKYTTSEMTFLSGAGRMELMGKVQARLTGTARSELEYVLERVFDKKWGVKRSKA